MNSRTTKDADLWCEAFAALYRVETKLDGRVCMNLARSAYRVHDSSPPQVAIKRLLAGAVTQGLVGSTALDPLAPLTREPTRTRKATMK